MAKISIKLASKGKTNFDLSSRHKTTTDFGQLQVSNIIPVVPNDSFHVSLASEARFAPLVVPTFMQAKLVTRAFYVPMSAIYQPFENFYSDKQDSTAYKTLPSFSNRNVVDMFLNRENGLVRFVSGSEIPDFVALNSDSNERRCIFTEKGRLLVKLFESLGYSFNWTRSDFTSMSMLPILAFARICYDYIYPSQYLDGLGLTKYFKITSSDDMSACFGDASKIVAFFLKVCDLLTLPYKQDYFTASWQDLNRPGTTSQNVSRNNDNGSATFDSDFKSPRVLTDTVAGQTVVNENALKLLRRVYDFVTRNNIVGTRYADQIFAKFGIGSRKSDPDMSQFIGQSIQPIRVVDVTAMTAAENQDLGDLGGKAYLQGKDKLFSFDSTDEFGYIICLSFVMPEVGYYQGRKRWTTCYSRFDFYNPEFDMQMRAIRNDELFADYRHYTDYANGGSYGGTPYNTFSFAPNYSEYKKGEDFITGDFRVPSLRKNLDSYYLMRDIKAPSVENPLALNANFLFCKQHEFDKIFAQMYTLRLNISHVPAPDDSVLNWYQEIITRDGLPVVFWYGTAVDDESTIYWLLTWDVDGTVNAYELTTTQLGKLGITSLGDGSQASWCEGVDNGGSAHVLKFTFGSIAFCLTNASSHICLNTDNYSAYYYACIALMPSYDSETHASPLDYDEFLMNWQDYIDHIYLDHHFDIKASRSMVPISEEFMIEDGGSKVNVDMNGNRIV